MDVAEDLIQRNGLNAVSYKHLSEAVGIRTASIHYHFPHKKDLVNALLTRCDQTYGAEYRRIAGSSLTAPEKLHYIAEIFKNGVISGKICLIGVLSSDLTTLDESSRLILETTLEQTISTFASIFRRGREESFLDFQCTAHDAAYAFFSLLIGVQILARVKGGANAVQIASEVAISNYLRK